MHEPTREIIQISVVTLAKYGILLFLWLTGQWAILAAFFSMQQLTHIFDPRDVMAVWMSGSGSSKLTGKASLISSRRSRAIFAACSYPSATRIGWMPLSRSVSACSRRAPANTAVDKKWSWQSTLYLYFRPWGSWNLQILVAIIYVYFPQIFNTDRTDQC